MHIHLDAIGGMAGDMFAAALLDAFPEHEAGVRASIRAATREVACERVAHNDGVLQGSRFVVEAGPTRDNDHVHDHRHEHAHAHHHDHAHRHWSQIRAHLGAADLDPAVRAHALAIFGHLAEAEARVHGIAVEDVAFHEVGALDSIADIVAAAHLAAATGAETWSVSALPLGFAIADLRKASNAAPKNLKPGLAFIAMTLASVPASWALAGALLPGRSQDTLRAGLSSTAAERPSCTAEASITPLAAEPVGVVAGASNLGSPILRYTGHRVLSAPYHRNQGGMLTELHIGLSNPHQAEAFLRGAHVTLLAFCGDDTQTRDIAEAEPGGLYADLLKGRVPAYLEPVAGTQNAALQLYRVRPE